MFARLRLGFHPVVSHTYINDQSSTSLGSAGQGRTLQSTIAIMGK
jgi:hypothetical protein